MKIVHRPQVPGWFAIPESDPVDDCYAAQVHEVTERGERKYRKAREHLQRAERALAKAVRKQQTRKAISELQDLVALRRTELEACRKLMTAAPVGQSDKQIRHRTGLDDHLELGIRKPPKRAKRMRGR